MLSLCLVCCCCYDRVYQTEVYISFLGWAETSRFFVTSIETWPPVFLSDVSCDFIKRNDQVHLNTCWLESVVCLCSEKQQLPSSRPLWYLWSTLRIRSVPSKEEWLGEVRGVFPDLSHILWGIWLSVWDSALVACGPHSVERCLSICMHCGRLTECQTIPVYLWGSSHLCWGQTGTEAALGSPTLLSAILTHAL